MRKSRGTSLPETMMKRYENVWLIMLEKEPEPEWMQIVCLWVQTEAVAHPNHSAWRVLILERLFKAFCIL